MWRVMVVVLLLAGCAPLEPGETRCFSSTSYGNTSTHCRTGQQPTPQQAALPAAPPGWWCSIRTDGVSACMRQPGQCEVWRAGGNARDDGNVYGACGFSQVAICSSYSGCYLSPDSCSGAEMAAGRNASACVAVR